MSKALSPTMQALLIWMGARPDKSVHRHPGGFWWEEKPEGEFKHRSFGTNTVDAVVSRKLAEWVAWKGEGNNRFPIQARLV